MRRLTTFLLACILMAGCVTTGTPTPTRTPLPTATATPTLEAIGISLPTVVSMPTAQSVYPHLTAAGIITRRDVALDVAGTGVPTYAPTPTITPVPLPRGAWRICLVSPAGVMVGCTELQALGG